MLPFHRTGEPPPELAEGLRLLGEFKGGGSKAPGFLLRRESGEFLLVSPLLYGLVEEMDGTKPYGQIAESLNERFGKTLSPEDVLCLLDRLRPLGVLAGSASAAQPTPPLLGVRSCATLIPAGVAVRAARISRHLFRPSVLVPALVSSFAIQLVIIRSELPIETDRLFRSPAVLLAVLGVTLLGGLFHELGHASAAAYSGAEPGRIGVGMHLVWPAFFTDVTDAYALGRAGRLRTDLGGVYFNVLLALGFSLAYAFTGHEVWFWAMLAQELTIVQQFLPFLRLDGYYVACDLAGVPDLFSLMRPTSAAFLRRRKRFWEAIELGPGAAAFVLIWSAATVAFLAWFGIRLALAIPGIAHTALTLVQQLGLSGLKHLAGGSPAAGLAELVVSLLVAVQTSALGLLIYRLGRLSATSALRRLRKSGPPK